MTMTRMEKTDIITKKLERVKSLTMKTEKKSNTVVTERQRVEHLIFIIMKGVKGM